MTQFDRDGDLRPGFVFGLTRQLDKHVNGTLSLMLGAHQTVTTTIAYDDALVNHASVTVAVSEICIALSDPAANNSIVSDRTSDFIRFVQLYSAINGERREIEKHIEVSAYRHFYD